MINRRNFISTVSMLALGACVTQGNSATVAQTTVTDIKLITNALSALGVAVAMQANVPASVIAQVQSYAAQANVAAASVVPGILTAAAQPSVTTISDVTNSIVASLASFNLPDNLQKVLVAAQSLLPLVEAAVEIVVAVGVSKMTMSPDQARMILATR